MLLCPALNVLVLRHGVSGGVAIVTVCRKNESFSGSLSKSATKFVNVLARVIVGLNHGASLEKSEIDNSA